MRDKVLDNLLEELINEQFKIAGHNVTFKELADRKEEEDKKEGDDMWFHRYTITKDQEEDFKKFAIRKIKKVWKLSDKRATIEFGWFLLSYGLRREDYVE
jgi:hypothetical protein